MYVFCIDFYLSLFNCKTIYNCLDFGQIMINHHVDCLRKNYKKQTKIIMNGPVSETTTQTYIDLVNQQQPFDQKLVAGFINLNMFF